ncbi:hypothetical protein [Ruania rhizosphaerae]|uniref:hypothetical protein n=1 Tax=Ruania rhizosphaerae TaxID=1840413 RepID=UPI001359FE15|nr:hypothetical protein [Ruania rhizosphaerae]
MRGRVAMAAVLAVSTAILTGCSDGRSVGAFCEVHDTHRDRYLASMDVANGNLESDPVLGLLQGGSAIADLANMWHELAEVAPEEIRSDTERVAELWDAQSEQAAESVGDPLGGLAGILQTALTMSGPLNRVDEFVIENC